MLDLTFDAGYLDGVVLRTSCRTVPRNQPVHNEHSKTLQQVVAFPFVPCDRKPFAAVDTPRDRVVTLVTSWVRRCGARFLLASRVTMLGLSVDNAFRPLIRPTAHLVSRMRCSVVRHSTRFVAERGRVNSATRSNPKLWRLVAMRSTFPYSDGVVQLWRRLSVMVPRTMPSTGGRYRVFTSDQSIVRPP